MTNIIIHGCGGKMGRVVAELVAKETDCRVVAGIDPGIPARGSSPSFGNNTLS